nr:type II restriction endonuclease [Novosphingobium panipatense]
MLGEEDRRNIPTTFIYLADDDPEPLREQAWLSWYDTRRKQSHRGPEYRLYFPDTVVSDNATEGDLLIIGVRPDDSLMAIIAESGSTIAGQLLWLFGVDHAHPGYSVKGEIETNQLRLEFASRFILEELGVDVESADDDYLDQMNKRFGSSFPGTREFSNYTRETLGDLDIKGDPDGALMALVEREEVLFRTFERHLIGDQLQEGFDEVDEFVRFSLSVQNRRKKRMGTALENHLEYMFQELGIRADRNPVTEGKSKPDFIFPGITEYHDPAFETQRLTMLGVKSTCKDRWRQVLSEADRIPDKHLLTLEPSISLAQTDEMRRQRLQLVLPSRLHLTYAQSQQSWLLSISTLVELLHDRDSIARSSSIE